MRRLPKTSVNLLSADSSSVLAMMDRMGVMPEPAAKPTRCRARGLCTVKRPSGGITRSASPAFSSVAAQFENTPPSTGRMPSVSSPCCVSRLRGLLME